MTILAYTLPNCDTCEEIKEYLSCNDIEYEEQDTSSQEGLYHFRNIYKTYRDKIRKDEDGIVLPCVIFTDIGKVGHTLEEVKNITMEEI